MLDVLCGERVVCLAFKPNGVDTDIGVYGNIQPRTFEVIYDVLGGHVRFGAKVLFP